MDHLQTISTARAITDPSNTGVISVDVINGFCTQGPLASPRVQSIVLPIVSLFNRCWSAGVRQILLLQDTHEPDAVEFGQFPPHCVRGTQEAETVPEFKELPFFNQIRIMEKNSIHSGLNTGLNDWLQDHPQVNTFIVVGDCTDLCTYQLAMHLRLDANARQKVRRVILPVDCVATYDLPVDTAARIGAFPHDGDLLHLVFLHHMALNGIEVVASIQ
jgi:nicotinamidase-related amidase